MNNHLSLVGLELDWQLPSPTFFVPLPVLNALS